MIRVFSKLSSLLFRSFYVSLICFTIGIFSGLSLFGFIEAQSLKASIEDSAKTKIMILETFHLSSLGDQFKSSLLENLIRALEHFKPDLIGIESISPFLLEDMEQRRDKFADVISQFAKLRVKYGHEMQKILGVSRQKAEDKASFLFPAVEDKSEGLYKRAELVQYLLASYDDISALLQWSYLPKDFRLLCKGFPDEIRAYMNNQLESSNEIISIGLSLARRLGLKRVEYVDDHHDKDILLEIAPRLMAELQDNSEYNAVLSDLFYKNSKERLDNSVKEGDLLPYYRYINSFEYSARDVDLQWNIWFRTKLQSGLDRSRIALWEVRNLNISSHIRRATALHPGKRMLVIIGAGHKPFLESYLAQMADIKLVQLKNLKICLKSIKKEKSGF